MPLTSRHFSAGPTPVRHRLERCLVNNPDHFVPRSRGPEVARIQHALSVLGNATIAQRELDEQFYGDTTVAAVLAFKKHWNIVNYEKKLDPIVGINTLGRLDTMMADREKRNAPSPAPLPPPIVGVAGVQIGPMDHRRRVIDSYYRNCGLETIGPGQIITGGIRNYATLEDLIDILVARPEGQQVILNHGFPDRGLLVRCSKETSYAETGRVMYLFSGLADIAEKGPIDPAEPKAKVLLGVAQDMKVSRAVVLRIVDKLVQLRKKQLILHFRACHLDDDQMVQSYKSAFGARMITYHSCRIFFFPIRPALLGRGYSLADYSPDKSTKIIRARIFNDPLGLLPDLGIRADMFGESRAGVDVPVTPEEIGEWAGYLVRWWRQGNTAEFVVPVMWEDEELTYYCPLEEGWRQKLKRCI